MARKTRRSHRKGTRKATRRMRGGFIANVNDTSMNGSSALQLKQGGEYLSAHAGQHGGSRFRRTRGGQIKLPTEMKGGQNLSPPPMVMNAAPVMNAPVMNGGQNVSPPPMVMNAAPVMTGGMAPVGDTGMLDASLRGFARVSPLDMSTSEIVGMKDQSGGRRRKSGRKGRKGRKSGRKGRKGRKTGRRMKGGSASVDDPTMILPADMLKQAVMGMNPEWKLAENPASFTPTK